MIRASVLATFLLTGALFGRSAAPSSNLTTEPSARQSSANPYAMHHSPSKRARLFYGLGWGVDSLSVKSVESGELIRFSYRVTDAAKAAELNDKRVEPALYGHRSHVKLVIPSLEKVGQLRNKSTPETGKSYWMAFSNKGGFVKKGDHVTVVIGKFHASNLIVQ